MIDLRQHLSSCSHSHSTNNSCRKRTMITLKRAYDSVSRTDGTRFLVERLWPRGVSKAKLRVDACPSRRHTVERARRLRWVAATLVCPRVSCDKRLQAAVQN